MIFSEIYGSYYHTVSEIIKQALESGVTSGDISRIISENAFSESHTRIEPSLKSGEWPFINPDGKTVLKNVPSFPLSTLQKRWLKSVSLDPRIQLFDCSIDIPEDTEPLFTPDDYCIFDRYSDGDNYSDEGYISRFRTVLSALKEGRNLRIVTLNGKGVKRHLVVKPLYLEYSEKDDKFRLAAGEAVSPVYINLGRMEACEIADERLSVSSFPAENKKRSLCLEITDERNALERVMLHFSHFEKEAVRTGDRTYALKIMYDKNDETELIIRILSFGPLVKVTEPDDFTELIRERLVKQKRCGLEM